MAGSGVSKLDSVTQIHNSTGFTHGDCSRYGQNGYPLPSPARPDSVKSSNGSAPKNEMDILDEQIEVMPWLFPKTLVTSLCS